jgi:hypothetical protein
MKKTITLILLIFISYPYVNAQCWIGYDYNYWNNIADLEKRNLNGKVTSVTYSTYDIVDHFGEISKGLKNCEQEIFFNRDSTVSDTKAPQVKKQNEKTLQFQKKSSKRDLLFGVFLFFITVGIWGIFLQNMGFFVVKDDYVQKVRVINDTRKIKW